MLKMSLPRLLSSSMRRTLAQGLTDWARAVDDLVFPWTCLICGTEGGALHGPLCASCRARLLNVAAAAGVSACPRCALPAGPYADVRRGCAECRGRSLGFDAALALAPYAESVRDLCLRLKHERDAWLAPWLTNLLAEARQSELARLPRCLDRPDSPSLVAATAARLQSSRGFGKRLVLFSWPLRSPASSPDQGHGSSGTQGRVGSHGCHAAGLSRPAHCRLEGSNDTAG